MVYTHPKIASLGLLNEKVHSLRKLGKKILICHGHFNVIHPGHLRFLNFARSKADYIIASVMCEDELSKENREVFFSQEERALAISNLELVDAVIKSDNNILDIIDAIAPDLYLKGKEFEDQQKLIQPEIDAVVAKGGKVIFSSGDVEYNSTRFFSTASQDQLARSKYDAFLEACKKNEVDLNELNLNFFACLKKSIVF
jgi:cytidyltransferase-like protein